MFLNLSPGLHVTNIIGHCIRNISVDFGYYKLFAPSLLYLALKRGSTLIKVDLNSKV